MEEIGKSTINHSLEINAVMRGRAQKEIGNPEKGT